MTTLENLARHLKRRDHWADVLGCDVRAGREEIQRAYTRRFRELIQSGAMGREFGDELVRLDQAMKDARKEKAK